MFNRQDNSHPSPLNRLMGLIHSSHSIAQRIEAIEKLGELADSRAIPPLAAALNDPHDGIVRAAGQALTQIAAEHPHAAQPLIGAMLRQLWGGSIHRLTEKLSVFRPVAMMDALIETIDDQVEEMPIQINAMAGLAAMAHPESLDFLLDVVEDENHHSHLRELALIGLMRIHNQDDEEWLAEVIETHSSLIRQPVRAVLDQAIDAAPVPILASLLYHPDWSLCKRAAEELGAHRHPAAIPALLDILQEGHPHVRQQAVIALAEIGDPDAIAPLVDCFLSEHVERVKMAAHDALRRFQFDDHAILQPYTQRLSAALDDSTDYATSWLIRRLLFPPDPT